MILALIRLTARPDARKRPPIADLVGAADPELLMEHLVRGRLLVTLGRHLEDWAGASLPAWFTDGLADARTLARQHGLLQYTLTAQVARALDRRSIPVVPLKGTTLADEVHGDVGARLSTDLDLLVGSSDIDGAVEAVTELGWAENTLAAPEVGLPRLHRVMTHPERPPIELHWRVHWYESAYAREAMERSEPTPEGWSRLAPVDEVVFLLLFIARDGLSGLRQTVDVAAWWDAIGRRLAPGPAVREVAERHPALARSLEVAARFTEEVAGLEPGSLLTRRGELSRGQRLALGLANPWLEGSGQQIDAEVSLIDGLLSPPGSVGTFVRRRLLPPAHEAVMRDPSLLNGPSRRVWYARAMHGSKVAARYVWAVRRLASAPRNMPQV